MKKLLLILLFTTAALSDMHSEDVLYSATYGGKREVYYVDRKIEQIRWSDEPTTAGFITRFGYAFNYDAFTYGVSMYYQWGRIAGITAGFDGYYIPYKQVYRTIQDDIVDTRVFNLPLWNIRAGFMLSKYFLFGGMIGKTNIGDNTTLINMREDAWFADNSESTIMYGGFVTFVLPVSKWFGFNLDFAVTNKTGFNVGAGVNVTFPIK